MHVKRVRSRVTGEMIEVDLSGHVVKLRRIDRGAYVELDVRAMRPGVHAFPVGDSRERQVLVQPEDCEPMMTVN